MKKTDTLNALLQTLEAKRRERQDLKNPFDLLENLKQSKQICDEMNSIMDEIEGIARITLRDRIAVFLPPAAVFLSVILV